MSSKQEENKPILPDMLKDPKNGRVYQRGKFLGKGGFARCYELVDIQTKEIFAGKIVPKSLLVKPHQQEKMAQEISIHSSVKHQHIVGFHSYFEDTDNVYIILELCKRRSLMELHKRRKAVTEPEARYFMRQILLGVEHLHKNNIIHRDLKLGNVFLNDEMEVKIGDFGLATIFQGERKKTVCGTPNYIAPEILTKTGHRFEADIWSMGCILYTLLVGKPPFETSTLRDTYVRIKKNEYHIPSRVNPNARLLITKLLQHDPSKRPDVTNVLNDEFMTTGFLPQRLPNSCLTTAPRIGNAYAHNAQRKPLLELNTNDGSPLKSRDNAKKDLPPKGPSSSSSNQRPGSNQPVDDQPEDCYLKDLCSQISAVLAANPDTRTANNEDEAEDPKSVPMIWVTKWVDYSDKYGLGYQLCDETIGVLYNDFTKLLVLPDGESMHYIDKTGGEYYHSLKTYPGSLDKKVTLLRYFKKYMNDHLLKAAASMCPKETAMMARVPTLRTYFRTRSAIILHLTNGTLQINFYEDHTKIILCPLLEAVTYIDQSQCFRTFKFAGLQEHGCSSALLNRLKYAKNMLQKLMLNKTASVAKSASSQSRPTSVSSAQ